MSDPDSWTFTLNGRSISVAARGDVPLLYVLRNELGVRSARFGCGSGACGVCSVIVDGRARTSCDLPVSAVSGTSVATIEGFSGIGGHHPLVEALVAEQAGQCGYCLPGIVVRLKAFLDQTPNPTQAQIVEALDGNLCRCGAHPRILRAAMRAAETVAGTT